MRRIRLVLGVLLVALAFGASPPVWAQGSVGFEDMPGIQQAVSRTFSSPSDRDLPAGTGDPRELRKPVGYLLLAAVYAFDTEANARAAYELLQTDMNATGVGGQPLEVAPIALPIALEHVAGSAIDDTTGTRYDFTLAVALDGAWVYTVIGITTGAPAAAGVAATVRAMAAAEVGTAPVAFDAGGGSTGGLWGKVPSRQAVERHFRGITTVEDAAPFPA